MHEAAAFLGQETRQGLEPRALPAVALRPRVARRALRDRGEPVREVVRLATGAGVGGNDGAGGDEAAAAIREDEIAAGLTAPLPTHAGVVAQAVGSGQVAGVAVRVAGDA